MRISDWSSDVCSSDLIAPNPATNTVPMPLPLDTRATTTETPKDTKEEPPGKDDMRAFEHFRNMVTKFFARAAEQGVAPLLWRKSEGQWHSLSWEATTRPVAALTEGMSAMIGTDTD